jgi:hypothetical protein
LSREGGNAAKLTFMADHRSLLLSWGSLHGDISSPDN